MAPLPARNVISKHPDSVRILVLETDEPHPDTQREVGSFGEVFNELFLRAGDNHEPKLGVETMMQYIVEPEGGEVPGPEDLPDDLHAILITGSEWDAHADHAWIHKLMKLIQHIWVHRPDIRFTGICFGHQILCRSLGSRVAPEPNGEWELSHSPVMLNDVGRSLFGLPDDQDRIHLHQMHLDYVVNPPSPETSDLITKDMPVHVWGESDHTGVQGVYIRTRLFTSQGHMEFNEKYVRRQLELRVNKGTVHISDADDAAERANWMHDGLRVAKAVLRFYHGDDDEVK